MEPSATSTTACSDAGRAWTGRSSSTWPTRSTLVSARVSSRNTLEIIISEFMTCST